MTARLTKVRASASLHAHRKIHGLLSGEYAAVTTGRSMDFNDLREYVVGDDVKDIDWKATARAGHPLIKRYVAVRQHTVLLAVSTGRSMAALNDLQVAKKDLAVFVAGVVGWLAISHRDRVGLVYGDAAAQHAIDLGTTEVHLERCLAAIDEATRPSAARSDLPALLGYLVRTVRRRTILLLVCDDPELDDATVALLRRLAVQHEILLVTIGDLDPTTAALAGRSVVDVDSRIELDPLIRADERVRSEYAHIVAETTARRGRTLDRLGIVHEVVHDEDSALVAVFRLLERHRHAARR